MSQIDIVLVNWNSGDYLRKSLSFLSASEWNRKHAKVFVVDNASEDNSMQDLESGGLVISVIRNEQNQGFGAACNQGALQGTSPYILFLNLDVETDTRAIAESVDFMEKHPDITVFGCRQTDAQGQNQIVCSRHLVPGRAFNELSGLSFLFPKHFKHATLMRDWDHQDSRDVDNVMGAYYLIRRPDFESVGGFDERFFVYMEDIDLSLRIREKGGRVYFHSGITIIHHGQGSTSSVVGYRLYLGNQARLEYAKKHWPLASYLFYALSMFSLGVGVRLLHSIFTEQGKDRFAALEALQYHIGLKKRPRISGS